jgi:hypothetical protein
MAVIVGSIIASLVLVAIIAALSMFLIRRRRLDNETKRWTFYRHMMVQQPTVQPSSSSIYSASTLPEDPEQGLRTLPPVPSTQLSRSPMGSRPPIIHPASLTPSSTLFRSARPMSPIPRSPSPRTHRQRAIADQIEILRLQMLEVEREGVKDPTKSPGQRFYIFDWCVVQVLLMQRYHDSTDLRLHAPELSSSTDFGELTSVSSE